MAKTILVVQRNISSTDDTVCRRDAGKDDADAVKGSTSVRYNLSLHLQERDTRFVTFR